MSELKVKRNVKKGTIYSPIRKKDLHETPEEKVRQEYLTVLVNQYGYSLDQIDEEAPVTGAGSGNARADFLIWRSVKARNDKEHALIVVECKSDNVTINQATYEQGSNYAQYEQARFFVTHNNRETKYWKVDLSKRQPNWSEIEDIPHADATDKDIEALMAKLKVFKEDEFANALHKCHNIIRNREHLDPAAAFDEIAKILFIKTGFERKMRSGNIRDNVFSVKYLDEQRQVLTLTDPINSLFIETKAEYKKDYIFANDEQINLKPNTVNAIVKELERYNLSDTSEDIKGIAFERFLGRTFRGEIGQFFTPRTIVEFMIRMIDPKEGEIVCDPASGSGGFLIRFFEIVRQQIMADADLEYQNYKIEIENDKKLTKKQKAKLQTQKYEEIERQINQRLKDSRMWTLANRCIYGTDANDRMARTSKMNMIMHGDGHGGIHHHNGFLNINGIYEGRFDIILTNPPFGSNVEPTDVILSSDIKIDEETERQYSRAYGMPYKTAREKLLAAEGKPIASLFQLPKRNKKDEITGKIKTEVLFLERCLDLLKPGGRMGIVLPEGIFNNPSLQTIREFVEDRAKLLALISLPLHTFVSSKASVKASLLFLQKYDNLQKKKYDRICASAKKKMEKKYAPDIANYVDRINNLIDEAKHNNDREKTEELKKELRVYLKHIKMKIHCESRVLIKKKWDYPVFFYQAEKVGISATGEEDENELYPNGKLPGGFTSALEEYKKFLENPSDFF